MKCVLHKNSRTIKIYSHITPIFSVCMLVCVFVNAALTVVHFQLYMCLLSLAVGGAVCFWHLWSTDSVLVPPLCRYSAHQHPGLSCTPASLPLGRLSARTNKCTYQLHLDQILYYVLHCYWFHVTMALFRNLLTSINSKHNNKDSAATSVVHECAERAQGASVTCRVNVTIKGFVHLLCVPKLWSATSSPSPYLPATTHSMSVWISETISMN